MIVQNGFDDPAFCRGGVLAIGNFDGIHRGHQKMLSVLRERADAYQVPAVVLTFDPPPVQLLRPDSVPPRLTTLETKKSLIEQQGVDCLIVYPTDLALLNLSPEEFFDQIVIEKLSARGMVEGPNFYFGKNRAGDVNRLAELCAAANRELNVIEPEVIAGDWISSSQIRHSITEGNLSRAVKMLGRPYRLEGQVVAGEKRGRELGFPTANLAKIPTLVPANGVYAGWCHMDNNQHPAAVHIGPNPTFGEVLPKVEVHVLDFAGDLYGQRIDVDFLERIRGTKTFQNAEELKQQIQIDLTEVRRVTSNRPRHPD